MAWFRNHYTCDRCHSTWEDEWSCMCDDDCPHCGARHMTPSHSDDLTEIIFREGRKFIALRSPETAEHYPDYCELGRFTTRREAEAVLGS